MTLTKVNAVQANNDTINQVISDYWMLGNNIKNKWVNDYSLLYPEVHRPKISGHIVKVIEEYLPCVSSNGINIAPLEQLCRHLEQAAEKGLFWVI